MARTTRTTAAKPSLMSRLRGRTTAAPRTRTTRSTRHGLGGSTTTTVTKTTKTTHHPTGTHATHAPATHHRRRPGLGDKISGALMKLRGSLTRRPGKKAAGTRRMHGTDGRGARTHRRHYDNGVIEIETPAGTQTKMRTPSIAAADQALSTAVDLVAQVQQLQNRILEIEDILAHRDAEAKSLMEERSKWHPDSASADPHSSVPRARTLPYMKSSASFAPSMRRPSRAATFAAPVEGTEPPLRRTASSASSLSDIQAKAIETSPPESNALDSTSGHPFANNVPSRTLTGLDSAPRQSISNSIPRQSTLPVTGNMNGLDSSNVDHTNSLVDNVDHTNSLEDSVAATDNTGTGVAANNITETGATANDNTGTGVGSSHIQDNTQTDNVAGTANDTTAIGQSNNIADPAHARATERASVNENVATTPGAF